MPIRSRLTAVFTLGTAVVMAVVSALFLLTLRGGLTGNLDTTLLTRAADVVAQLGADPSATVATEAGNGIYVQILSPAGTVLDGADVLGTQTLLSPGQARAASTTPQTVDRALSFAAPSSGSSGSAGSSERGTDGVRVVALPGPGGIVVAAGTSRDGVDNAVRRAGIELLVLAVALVVVAALGSWLLARAALRPVESMRRQAALRTDEAAAGIDVPPGRDELARLAVTFNDLLGRLRHAVDREQAFVADAGHELRTPLTVLQGELELAQRPGRTLVELQGTVTVAAFETDRLVKLSEDLLVLARTGDLDRQLTSVDLVELVRDAVTTAGPAARRRRVHVRQLAGGPVAAWGHGPSLRRAVDNLVANALRYAPEGTDIEIGASATPVGWTITVRDHGPGFPPSFVARAFERFTQADPTRARDHDDRHPHGSGLGLAIVATIMAAHGGTATARNATSGGALVELVAPCRPPQT